jgi:DDE superfamily endonuclease
MYLTKSRKVGRGEGRWLQKERAFKSFNSEIARTIDVKLLDLIVNSLDPYSQLTTLKKHLCPLVGESGFMMCMIAAQMVFTGSEKRSNPKKIQPGDRDWVTIIQGICAGGWAIPPFIIIFGGKVLISSWYRGLPRD